MIVGAGYTGLWTAYYLLAADPTLNVVILEAEHAGFGASGRNGGWCSALFPTSWHRLVQRGGADGARALQQAMNQTVTEVGRVIAAERIEAGYHRGGTVSVARSAAQRQRMAAELATARARGVTEDDLRWLEADEAAALMRAVGTVGALFTPHCATIQPLALARELAARVVDRGARLFEGSPARSVEPGKVRTDHGSVRATSVVLATEAWTAHFPGRRRLVAPVYSLMIGTAPLSDDQWSAIGLEDRPTFSDGRHVIIYGQRTADGRLAFGGRGAPYHWRSRIEPRFDQEPTVFAALQETLTELFPVLRDVEITHRWGGPLGIRRDWAASVSYDRGTGLAQAGGYVGDGVGTANLAGRTLADLLLHRDTELTALPWVGHQHRSWEPEPLRWIAVNLGLRAMTWADREEQRHDRPSRIARALSPLIHG